MAISETRHSAKRIALYNHKGGVGKTTLTVNIAGALSKAGYRVLVVDSDPQCNLTSYYLADAYIDRLLNESDTDTGTTIWSALKPVVEEGSEPRAIAPIELPYNRNLFLLPGDIQLSVFENELVRLWDECFQRKQRAMNGTVSLSKLLNNIAQAYQLDFIFYDCGPNVGALNRAIILDTDFFIVPGALDVFSIRALTTLGIRLREWMIDWHTIEMLNPGYEYSLPGESKLLGYILQRFRIYKKQMTKDNKAFAVQFESELIRNIYEVLGKYNQSLTPISSKRLRLGAVSDFATRAVKAQQMGLMISEVGNSDQRETATKTFRLLARQIIERTDAQRP